METYRRIIIGCLACVFLTFPACGNNTDRGNICSRDTAILPDGDHDAGVDMPS